MPELPSPKLRSPASAPVPAPAPPANAGRTPRTPAEAVPAYAELEVMSNYSFLRAASHPDELVNRAVELGYRAIAVTDVNSMAGVVRAHEAARATGIKLLIGSRLTLTDGPELLIWAIDRAGYGRLCRLLTTGKRRAAKAECRLELEDVLADGEGWMVAATGDWDRPEHGLAIRALRDVFGPRLSLSISAGYGPDDHSRLRRLVEVAKDHAIEPLATNAVCYHDPARRALQDVLTCVRHGCAIREAGFRLLPNAERHLKSPARMHRLFLEYPQAIRRGLAIAEVCGFNLGELRYEYPHEVTPEGISPARHLADLAWRGAAEHYPDGVPEKVRRQIEHELALIEQLKYEAYFLTVHDLVGFARSRRILCQGRGSAANSAVCYCLGITAVDPNRIDVLFERFVSAARNEPPDIDVDFEHERREEVIQYLYEKYGRERAGMTAEVITYRGRSAVRDVGKAMGLTAPQVDVMAKRLDWWDRGTITLEQVRQCGLDPADRRVRQVIALSGQLLGFPRHLSQHVGGMVMTRGALCEMVPIENAAMPDRTVIEWDKNDIDALGILKVDVLALGMLTAIAKVFKLLKSHEKTRAGEENLRVIRDLRGSILRPFASSRFNLLSDPGRTPSSLCSIPSEDPAVYDMICEADTVGVFQIESRAQMSMLPRLKPRCFYDLVIEVAIVRPGPIQGNMVHPYLRRRNGLEPVEYPSEALRQVLEKTLGVPLFQEQAMRVAMVGAGFSAEEADQLRRAMAAWRKHGALDSFQTRIVQGMLANGYTRQFAEQCFEQIKGFGEYGFPESHAASFALLVYVSAWLKRYYPAAFAAALLNSQPMGFYAPAQLVRDAKEHGVEVRGIDVNFSAWDCTLEGESQAEGRAIAMDSESQIPDLKSSIPNSRSTTSDCGFGISGIESDSRCRGAAVRADKSTWGAGGPALRLGFRQISGMPESLVRRVAAARERCGRFDSIEQLHQESHAPKHVMQRFAEADTFASLGLSRREAMWRVMGLSDVDTPLCDDPSAPPPLRPFAPPRLGTSAPSPSRPAQRRTAPKRSNPPRSTQPFLPLMPLGQEVMADYATHGLSLKAHPLALLRDELDRRRIVPAAALRQLPAGRWAKVAGLVLIRQRPATASGVVFITLEDETGGVNLILRPKVYEKYRDVARHGGLIQADGYLERQGLVQHLMAVRLIDLSSMLEGLKMTSRDFH